MRNSETSIYKKVIAISQEDMDFIDRIKKTASKAGMLRKIILFYKENYEKKVLL